MPEVRQVTRQNQAHALPAHHASSLNYHPGLEMSILVKQALISVSDKTGVVEFARALAQMQVAILSTGGTAKLLARQRHRRDRGGRIHRLSGNARRPREDPAPEDPRRPAGTPRPARAHGGDQGRTASSRSIWRWSTSTRSPRPSPSPAARWRRRSRTSTSAARPWCARRPRTHAGVAVLVDPADYPPLLDELKANGGSVSAATRFALAKKSSRIPPRYDGAISNYLTGARRGAEAAGEYPGAADAAIRQGAGPALRREPAPERGVLSRHAAGRRQPRRATPSCRARNCPTTTSPMPTPPGNA